jgi:4-methyl-5(b-hydroxyethyl)-thiazole monophosphate biosynthesis
MDKVLTILAAGFEEIEAITVIDLLRRADIHVTVAGLNELLITGSHSITVKCDTLLDNVSENDYRYLVLPGGQPGTNNLKTDSRVIGLVQRFSSRGDYLAAICAAPTVFSAAGVAANHLITSYPSEQARFNPDLYKTDNVVTDGKLITSRGVGTAIDFSLQLVTIIRDRRTAADLAKRILWQFD